MLDKCSYATSKIKYIYIYKYIYTCGRHIRKKIGRESWRESRKGFGRDRQTKLLPVTPPLACGL